MWCQASIFEIRRCAFGDKLYGVAENYGREGVDVKVNNPRSPGIELWDSRSNKVNRMIFSFLCATYSWPYSLRIGPRGWSVTLSPLGSLSLLDRACELNFLGTFRVVCEISGRLANRD
ncbi:hypothetical protein PIB30_050458 [Stylosanthes scabra]|uniref:Uncharacterized protein n=1 Tax=Stylosanthes scabra TaxID=79078 RepID=A0ABU6VKL3_9FABA|nr:hypothetical protein [Stylosanthes scabra]